MKSFTCLVSIVRRVLFENSVKADMLRRRQKCCVEGRNASSQGRRQKFCVEGRNAASKAEMLRRRQKCCVEDRLITTNYYEYSNMECRGLCVRLSAKLAARTAYRLDHDVQ